MNLNELARKITLKEGGKVNLSIAQVKEVMRLTFSALSRMSDKQVRQILDRY